MLFAILAAAIHVQAAASPGIPPAPKPPPPFSADVEAVARLKGMRVFASYETCGDARARSNARAVEAFGTPQHSAEWEKATAALKIALFVCQEQRRALRDKQDFMEEVATNGSSHDRDLSARQVESISYELKAIEQYYTEETIRYRHLVMTGWGSPHCDAHPDGYMPPSSICKAGEDPFKP